MAKSRSQTLSFKSMMDELNAPNILPPGSMQSLSSTKFGMLQLPALGTPGLIALANLLAVSQSVGNWVIASYIWAETGCCEASGLYHNTSLKSYACHAFDWACPVLCTLQLYCSVLTCNYVTGGSFRMRVPGTDNAHALLAGYQSMPTMTPQPPELPDFAHRPGLFPVFSLM